MKHLRSGPHDYELRSVDGMSDRGTESFEGTRIDIDTTCSIGVQFVATWHELFHTLLDHAGIPEKEQKENILEIASHGIVQVLRDNPQMATLAAFEAFIKE